nr:hypothetical protein NitaMp027 [Ipomoea trifida]
MKPGEKEVNTLLRNEASCLFFFKPPIRSRSPLLTGSRLISLPLATKMFQFAKFEKSKERRLATELGYGFPIGDPWITDAINFAFVDEIPREALEWQFLLLGRSQINDYLNRGFEHKDSTDLHQSYFATHCYKITTPQVKLVLAVAPGAVAPGAKAWVFYRNDKRTPTISLFSTPPNFRELVTSTAFDGYTGIHSTNEMDACCPNHSFNPEPDKEGGPTGQGTVSGRQFLWGVGLPKGNGGVQRFPRAGRRLALECKGRRELDCKTHPSSRDESRP